MNRNRMLIGLTVAVVVGLFLSTYVYRAFKNASAVKPFIAQHIVVAAIPLQLGTRVDANNLRLIPWPSDEPVSGMFTRIEDCANRALITPVAENEPILESKLAATQSGAGLPATIPEGMRALSVAVNEVVGVAGFVIPGTMVDVLVTGNVAGGRTRKQREHHADDSGKCEGAGRRTEDRAGPRRKAADRAGDYAVGDAR